MVTFFDIESAMTARLLEQGVPVQKIIVDTTGAPQFKYPCIVIGTDSATFQKRDLGLRSMRCNAIMSALVMVQNSATAGSEKIRHTQSSLIIFTLVSALMGNRLALDIAPMEPADVRNVSTEEDYSRGITAHLVRFKTSFDVVAVTGPTDMEGINAIDLQYRLDPPGIPADAEDTLIL